MYYPANVLRDAIDAMVVEQEQKWQRLRSTIGERITVRLNNRFFVRAGLAAKTTAHPIEVADKFARHETPYRAGLAEYSERQAIAHSVYPRCASGAAFVELSPYEAERLRPWLAVATARAATVPGTPLPGSPDYRR